MHIHEDVVTLNVNIKLYIHNNKKSKKYIGTPNAVIYFVIGANAVNIAIPKNDISNFFFKKLFIKLIL
jgi:hypothetical protein